MSIFSFFSKSNKRKPLSEEERIAYLQSLKVDNCVYEYLSQLLTDLNIDVMSLYEGKIMSLMSQNKLIGWCWQTAETASIFFDDNDYVERGYLFLDPHRSDYFHSWISFNFNNKQYIFDPCLNIICKREDFYRIFQVNIIARIKASIIKNTLKNKILCKNNLETLHVNYRNNDELIITGAENINGPFFRGTRGYTVDIDSHNSKILKLNAHYYDESY